ncbi:NAD(P)-binding protein [Saccharata proteae CBS 121410]|uniref:NAD(P)-binding protein n=1 Tax=Saccharata proteae CBS 121410 TaxID=1314787 RepID=A0A9P4HWC1_9PEZI|nr:NAD(P)-binding protein [Saccharata proteae CBS 121410]
MAELPPRSTILVTGANGYIASTIIQAFIHANHKVIGTVRDSKKSAWLNHHFPASHFQLHELPSLSDHSGYESAISKHKPTAVVLTTFATKFEETDPDAYIPTAIKEVLAPLEVAARHPDAVKSVTVTGSAWSVFTPKADVPRKLTTETWNEDCVAEAYAPAFADPFRRGLAVLMACKTKLEQAAWRYVRETNPGFRFNVVQIESAFGPPVAPVHQGAPSTAGMLKMLFHGQNLDFVYAVCAPQWYVDVRDGALLHVACATRGDVDRERVFGFAGRYSWGEVLGLMEELYPGREMVERREGEGVDMSEVPNERALELLKGMGRHEWIGLRETVKDTVDGFLGLEGSKSGGDAFGFYSK